MWARSRGFALFVAVVALSQESCSRPKKLLDAGAPVVAGELLAGGRIDAFAQKTYDPRLLARLDAATPVNQETVVPMPAGLHLRAVWEMRDDFVFGRRYLTLIKLTVDHVDAGSSCVVRSAHMKATLPPADTSDSLRATYDIDYVCTQGRNTSSFGGPVGSFDEDGFVRLGAASGTPQPRAPQPDGEAPAITVIHFKPAQATLEPDTTKTLDAFVKVLTVDPKLTLCVAAFAPNAKDDKANALEKKRRATARGYLVAHGVAEARIAGSVATGQTPPAADDLELWPDKCEPPTTKKRR